MSSQQTSCKAHFKGDVIDYACGQKSKGGIVRRNAYHHQTLAYYLTHYRNLLLRFDYLALSNPDGYSHVQRAQLRRIIEYLDRKLDVENQNREQLQFLKTEVVPRLSKNLQAIEAETEANVKAFQNYEKRRFEMDHTNPPSF